MTRARARNTASKGRGRAVGYLRRSTDRQEQSIPDQKRDVERYIKDQGLRLVKHYIDDAISGTSTAGRRGFQQMIEDAQQPHCPFDTIVVYDVKRFGRVDNDEAGYYRHVLKTHGVEVLYVSENFNGDATDDLLRPVKQWQARQESKDLSKVTIRGLMSKAESGDGTWMGGCPPYGYDLKYENATGECLFVIRYMPDGTKQQLDQAGAVTRTLERGESLSISKQDKARLVPSSKDRTDVIKRIFKGYAHEGKGYKTLAQTLNEEGVATPRGPAWSSIYSGKWTCTTIRAILVNPIYAGDMVWNRRTDARFHRISNGRAVERDSIHGHRLVPNDETDWIITRDAHPALIDRRLAEQMKQRRDSKIQSLEQRGKDPRMQAGYRGTYKDGVGTPDARRRYMGWNGKRSRFILSGLLTCTRCGNRYQGYHRNKGKKRMDGTRTKSFGYGCGGYITKGTSVCQMNSIPQEVLEKTVIDAVLDF